MKKSVELKQQLDALKTDIQNMMDEGKVEEAHARLADVENLKNEIEVQEMLENQQQQQFQGQPIKTPVENVDANVVFNKQLLGKKLTNAEMEYLNTVGTPGQVEHDDARGGYLVPEQQFNQIIEFKRELNPLKGYCNVINVLSDAGSMPIEVAADEELSAFEELNEITQSNATFNQIKFAIADYGDIVPISNTLLADEKANLTGFIGRRFAKKAVRTENKKILTILESASAASSKATDYTAIKTALNKDLDPAISAGAIIITNQSGFDWLDGLQDKTGRPVLSPSLADPTKKVFEGHEVVVISDAYLKQVGTKYVFYIGNMSEFIAFFDRQGVEMAVSTEAGFTKNATLMRVVERFDVKQVDAKAMVKLTITVAP